MGPGGQTERAMVDRKRQTEEMRRALTTDSFSHRRIRLRNQTKHSALLRQKGFEVTVVPSADPGGSRVSARRRRPRSLPGRRTKSASR